MTRGPLPAAVYWRRRAAMLGTLLLLLIGVVRMFGGGDDHDPALRASSADQTPSASASPTAQSTPSATSATTPVGTPPATAQTPTTSVTPSATAPATTAATPDLSLAQDPVALPTPTGHCSDDDVEVSVAVGTAVATRAVPFTLTIRTGVQAACLWTISSKTVQVAITSGSDDIWSTVECTKAIPKQQLTLRRDTPVTATVTWSSRRSDDTCSNHTQWATPGYYHVQVAALGGEPSDVQFRLRKPVPKPKVTATPTASPTATAAPSTSAATTEKSAKKKSKRTKSTKKKTVRDEPTSDPAAVD